MGRQRNEVEANGRQCARGRGKDGEIEEGRDGQLGDKEEKRPKMRLISKTTRSRYKS